MKKLVLLISLLITINAYGFTKWEKKLFNHMIYPNHTTHEVW